MAAPSTVAARTAALALREAMLEGQHVTGLEATLLFGVQNINAELARIKADGFIVKSQRIPMIAVVRRINQYATCKPPDLLPIREINLLEYWISR